MTSAWIVEALDEIEDREAAFGLRAEATTIQKLALQGGEEALAHGVVECVADGAHGGSDAGALAPKAEGDRRVLATVVRVVDDRARLALADRHVQGIEDEVGLE